MNNKVKRITVVVMIICLGMQAIYFPSTIIAREPMSYVIEDFNSMADPVAKMKPMDLSPWGIGNAELSIVSENAEEGKAMKALLNPTRFVQAYQIDDSSRTSVFQNVKAEHFLRLYVYNPNTISLGVTINLTGDSKQSFPDSTNCILTKTDGTIVATTTGNATEDAGPGSSVNVPANFEGWIAWPLNSIKQWAAYAALTDLTTVDYIRIDIRESGLKDGDYYTIDNFCITTKANGIDYSSYPVESTFKLDFSKSSDVAIVTNCIGIDVKQENNILKLTHEDSSDPGVHIRFPSAVNTEAYKYCAIKVRKSVGSGGEFEMCYNVLGGEATAAKVINGNYQDTTDWQLIILDFGSVNATSVGYLRYDTFITSSAGDVVEVESVRFFKTLEAAKASYAPVNPETNDSAIFGIVPVAMVMLIVILIKKNYLIIINKPTYLLLRE